MEGDVAPNYCWCLKLECFCYGTSQWRLHGPVFIRHTVPSRITDRRTDRFALTVTRLALCAVAHKNVSSSSLVPGKQMTVDSGVAQSAHLCNYHLILPHTTHLIDKMVCKCHQPWTLRKKLGWLFYTCTIRYTHTSDSSSLEFVRYINSVIIIIIIHGISEMSPLSCTVYSLDFLLSWRLITVRRYMQRHGYDLIRSDRIVSVYGHFKHHFCLESVACVCVADKEQWSGQRVSGFSLLH